MIPAKWAEADRDGVTYQGQLPARSDLQDPESSALAQAGEAMGGMQAISGYAQVYMPESHRVAPGARFPFSAQFGDYKNAHPEGNGIRIDDVGLWRAEAHIVAAPGNGSSSAVYEIEVRDYAGNVSTFKRLPTTLSVEDGKSFSHTFVVTTEMMLAGVFVSVRVWHDAFWWTWRGAPQNSSLIVNRWDIRTNNAASSYDPPLGTDIET